MKTYLLQMKKHHNDHPLGCPPVHIPDNSSSGYNVYNVLNRLVGRLHRGGIINHQNDPGKQHDQKQKAQDNPQTKGIGRFQGVHMHPVCMYMQKKVAIDNPGWSLSVFHGASGA